MSGDWKQRSSWEKTEGDESESSREGKRKKIGRRKETRGADFGDSVSWRSKEFGAKKPEITAEDGEGQTGRRSLA